MSRPTETAAVAFNIKKLDGKVLRAFFSLELPSGTIFNSCMLSYSKERRAFTVIPPHVPLVDGTGAFVRDHQGEITFSAAVSFRKSFTRQRFEATAIAALKQAAPELFERSA